MDKSKKLMIAKEHNFELQLQVEDFEQCIGSFPEDSELEALEKLTVKLRQAREEFRKECSFPPKK